MTMTSAERGKKYRLLNPESAKAAQKRYRDKHKEKYRAIAREKARIWRKANPEKHRENNKKHVLKHPDKAALRDKRSRLKRKYNMTVAEYDAMVIAQNGVCAIDGCNRHVQHIDHCHATGKVRGLLCSHCNKALGMIDDSINILSGMIKYLEKNK